MGLSRILIVLFGAPMLAACVGWSPAPEDWVAIGFRTPETTLKTFQTAIASDYPTLEYRCLSSGLRRREQLRGEIAYREFRDRLAKEIPFFRRIATAEVIEITELGPDRQRILAEVSAFFVERRFQIDFVREDYFETWLGDEPIDDEGGNFDQMVWRHPKDPRRIHAEVESQWDETELTELRIGREWKIDAFAQVESP